MNKRIVIVGAGFGGIELAKALRNSSYEVVLLDKNNYHTFQPLLYQVATGGLDAGSIAYPVRRIFRGQRNIRFQMAEVESVDITGKEIMTSVGAVSYDYLVMATGSANNYFNFDSVQDKLLTLKSVPEALDIRSYLMQNLELAIASYDPEEREELMNVAIVGGGPAGIELAGALAEMKRYVLPKDFPDMDFDKMSVVLFEGLPRLLNGMSEASSKAAVKFLEKLGVTVRLNAMVSDYKDQTIYLEDGTTFKTDTVIWSAGVKGNTVRGLSEDVLVAGSRLKVDAFNKVDGQHDIFAIGDVAAHITEEHPKGLPMLAPVAIQQAKHLGKNFKRVERGEQMEPFEYINKGVMATIGRNKAVVDLPKFHFNGTFAWFVWMFVHVLTLTGYRNKLVTFIDWTRNYFNYDRPLGLIIRPLKRKKNKIELATESD